MRSKLDIATIAGFVIAMGMTISAIALGGQIGNFVNLPSILLVVVGTVAATMMCFSLSEMMGAPKVISSTIMYKVANAKSVAMEMIRFSALAREKGILSLEQEIDKIKRNPLFYKSMRLLVDGLTAPEIESIVRSEMYALKLRQEQSTKILKKAGELAPGLGLIGTLIGLVQMLSTLEDPSSIGPAMSLALITTFYGAVLANVFFNPLAAKLERNSTEEEMVNLLYVIGATSIAKQENPRRLEMQLNAVLPPAQRVQFFD